MTLQVHNDVPCTWGFINLKLEFFPTQALKLLHFFSHSLISRINLLGKQSFLKSWQKTLDVNFKNNLLNLTIIKKINFNYLIKIDSQKSSKTVKTHFYALTLEHFRPLFSELV